MTQTATDHPQDDLSHRRVLTIAIPIVLSNATVPILGAVDTGVVGQMGQAVPIGAVAMGAIILTSIYWIFGFLRMGTVGLTSQAKGAGDSAEVSALLSRVLMIGFVAGLLILLFQAALFTAYFYISPASAEVEDLSRDYLAIRVWSAPAAIALYGINGWLIALEKTKSVLVLQLWMNGLNIVLDLVFVLNLGWGVQGVAIATFLAEWSGLILGLYLCRSAFVGPAWRDVARVFDVARLRVMALVNSDILIRSLLLQAMFVSFLFWGAKLGDVTLAANEVLMQFLHITAYALDGFAFAAETLIGQAMGARRPGLLRRSAIITSQWGIVLCLALSAVFWVIGPWMIDVMATSAEVREHGRIYLIYMILAPIFGCAAWMLDGIFIGATRTRDMRNMMIISAVIYFGIAPILMLYWGNHGLWIALLISFVVRGATLGLRYRALENAALRPV
ncbi:MATE family efflux transporter [Aestuariibius sp. HNIBRBA575]|uniref:MATE family efflux transporter n=1 Tax=Aestuariibius sp. HNIBRBA575 TaxID=3233343 RepID=UPI0034A3A9B9